MIAHMLSVGFAPGGVNRSHMAEVASYIDNDISRVLFGENDIIS